MVDYAIRKRPSGYEELVYARTLANDPKSRFISSNNLICPECGEPVILANGDERTYFRHLPNNPKTKDCPNYYSDDRYAALYQKQQEERKSGQRSRNIYILKGGDTFGLFLGFPPLEERIVTSARNENLIVQIINPHNAELKENRLLMSQVVAGENTYTTITPLNIVSVQLIRILLKSGRIIKLDSLKEGHCSDTAAILTLVVSQKTQRLLQINIIIWRQPLKY